MSKKQEILKQIDYHQNEINSLINQLANVEEKEFETPEEASARTGIDVKFIFETVFDGAKVYKCKQCNSHKLRMVHKGGFQMCDFECLDCKSITPGASVIKEHI